MKSLSKIFMLLTLPLACHGMELEPLTLDKLPQDYITCITQKIIETVGTPAIQNRADRPVIIKYIKWLSHTNKALYNLVNSQPVTSAMVTSLAQRFNIPPADAAMELSTPGAEQWVYIHAPENEKFFQAHKKIFERENAYIAQTTIPELKKSLAIKDEYPLSDLSQLPQWTSAYLERFFAQTKEKYLEVLRIHPIEARPWISCKLTLPLNDAYIMSSLIYFTKQPPHRNRTYGIEEHAYTCRLVLEPGVETLELKYRDTSLPTRLTQPALYQEIVANLTSDWHKASLTDWPHVDHLHHNLFSEEEWILLKKAVGWHNQRSQCKLIEYLAKKVGLFINIFPTINMLHINSIGIGDTACYLYLWIKKNAYDEVVNKMQLKIEEEKLPYPIQDSEDDLLAALAPYSEQMINNIRNIVQNNPNNQDENSQ